MSSTAFYHYHYNPKLLIIIYPLTIILVYDRRRRIKQGKFLATSVDIRYNFTANIHYSVNYLSISRNETPAVRCTACCVEASYPVNGRCHVKFTGNLLRNNVYRERRIAPLGWFSVRPVRNPHENSCFASNLSRFVVQKAHRADDFNWIEAVVLDNVTRRDGYNRMRRVRLEDWNRQL